MIEYRFAGACVGELGPSRVEPDPRNESMLMMDRPFPLEVGDIIEDWRPKRVFSPDPADTYQGDPGKVVDVSNSGFAVEWPPRDGVAGHMMGYTWAWLGRGLNKREVVSK